MAGVNWTDSTIEAGGIKLHLQRAGKGRVHRTDIDALFPAEV